MISGESDFGNLLPSELARNSRIVPIFGAHLTGKKADVQVEKSVLAEDAGYVSDLSGWPDAVCKRVRGSGFRIMAVDGLSAMGSVNDLFFCSPGNPFELRCNGKDIFYVGADFTYSLIQNFSSNPVVDALSAYYEKLLGRLADDPNGDRLTTRLFEGLAKQGMPELVGPILVFLIASSLSKDPLVDLGSILPLVAISGRVVIDKLLETSLTEHFPLLTESSNYINFRRLTKPFFQSLGDIDLRNAIVALKLKDAESEVDKTEWIDGPTIALWGNTHATGKNIWNSPDKQYDVVTDELTNICKFMDNYFVLNGYSFNDQLRDRTTRGLSLLFGLTNIWRVKEASATMLKEEVERQIPTEKRFQSKTITAAVGEAIGKVWKKK